MSKAKTAHQVFGAVKLTADPTTAKLLMAAGEAATTGAKKRFANLTRKVSEHKAIKNGPLGSWGFVSEDQTRSALIERASALLAKSLATNNPTRVGDALWLAGALIKIASYIEVGAIALAVRFCLKAGITRRDLPKQARKFFKDFI